MAATRSEPERYRVQSRISDPGRQAGLYAGLPGTVADLVKVVQGLIVHIFWAERYGITPTDEQKRHVQARLVERTLTVMTDIDPAPLTVARPLARRFFGNCRDFSLLLTSMLRSQGVPARARCGFGTYFLPDHYEDHWCCEYWNGQRWVSVDAQLDSLQREKLGIDFDPLDMPPGKFVPASDGWLMCRAGREDPDKFGIMDMHGLWFIAGNLIRELAALNGAEMLPWDVWGLMTCEQLSELELALLDEVARALKADSDADIRRLYADERLRAPAEMMKAGI
ncbi:MAG: transglutaminase-like domain-containing protein [Chloroflexota bacterium]